eukprot:54817_1
MKDDNKLCINGKIPLWRQYFKLFSLKLKQCFTNLIRLAQSVLTMNHILIFILLLSQIIGSTEAPTDELSTTNHWNIHRLSCICIILVFIIMFCVAVPYQEHKHHCAKNGTTEQSKNNLIHLSIRIPRNDQLNFHQLNVTDTTTAGQLYEYIQQNLCEAANGICIHGKSTIAPGSYENQTLAELDLTDNSKINVLVYGKGAGGREEKLLAKFWENLARAFQWNYLTILKKADEHHNFTTLDGLIQTDFEKWKAVFGIGRMQYGYVLNILEQTQKEFNEDNEKTADNETQREEENSSDSNYLQILNDVQSNKQQLLLTQEETRRQKKKKHTSKNKK